ncbi:Mur ligase [Thozetella sp. PMI_491]|nr:Mur ligase [Thozetella sp. PMI_491]
MTRLANVERTFSDVQLDNLNIIHVAGTKGKGSTCAFIESILRARGLKTGLYTGPHLIDLTERIRINFIPLSKELFTKYVFDIYECLCTSNPSPRYLQMLLLVSFRAFLEQGVDVAIYETHHGGQFDATNVIPHPKITAITTLGMDHVDQLGPTIQDIAWHKGGIFKRGAFALSAPQEPSLVEILQRRAAEKGTSLKMVEVDPNPPVALTNVNRINYSVARAVCDAFPLGKQISEQDLVNAIRRCYWPGRFQTIVDGDYSWFLDGAHNELSVPEAGSWFHAQSLSAESHTPIKRILIFAQMSNYRDGEDVLRCLASSLRTPLQHVIVTNYENLTGTVPVTLHSSF